MVKTRHIHVHLNLDEWEEGKHPRASNGEFGAGGGGSAAAISKLKSIEPIAKDKGTFQGKFGPEVSVESAGFTRTKSVYGVPFAPESPKFSKVEVPIHKIKMTQASAGKSKVEEYIKDPGSDPPDVLFVKDENDPSQTGMYQLSGTHRLVAASLSGTKSMPVNASILHIGKDRKQNFMKPNKANMAKVGFDPNAD